MNGGLQRCLWIAREMPMPLTSGDRVYSYGLVSALAGTGVAVTYLGHENDSCRRRATTLPTLRWEGIEGGTRSYYWVALTDPLPVTAAIHDTAPARRRLLGLLDETRPWQAIVFDQLGSAWALRPVLNWIDVRRRADPAFQAPCLVYLAHNHERVVWRDMARDAQGPLPRRLAVVSNARKIARLEAALVRQVDQVINITREDALAMQPDGMRRPGVVITPGYAGTARPPRTLDERTPRRVLIVGSFKWAIKQENLRRFLTAADPVFARHGIALDVVGMVPTEMREAFEPHLAATTLHGYVEDIGPLFDRARLAVVPEMIGGGFKLKFLDYIFGRLPVVSIAAAAAGLPDDVRRHVMTAPDLDSLVQLIVDKIDGTAELEHRQQAALASAVSAFAWADRGRRMRQAIEAVMQSRQVEAHVGAAEVAMGADRG